VTTISTRVDNGAWTVSGISDTYAEAEISELRNANPGFSSSTITLYEVPNIDARVYSLRIDGQELYYTNYKGRSISEPIELRELASMLRTDALAFERQYGDMMKKGKLVK
jgi:hypothetical protein